MNENRQLKVSKVEWRQQSEMPPFIEIELTTNYEGFRFFEDAIAGVHHTSAVGEGAVLAVNVPVRLLIRAPKI